MTDLDFCPVLGNVPTKVSRKAICLCSISVFEMQIPSAACFSLSVSEARRLARQRAVSATLCPTDQSEMGTLALTSVVWETHGFPGWPAPPVFPENYTYF